MPKAKATAAKEVNTKPEEEEALIQPLDEDHDKRQEDRKREWGQQFHKWLINSARRSATVKFDMSEHIPGISDTVTSIIGIPKRVDRDFVQVVVGNQEIWVQLKYIVSCQQVESAEAK